MALSKKAHEALRRALTEDKAVDEVEGQLSALDNVAPIADPATATAEDCANKINEILAAMQSDKSE